MLNQIALIGRLTKDPEIKLVGKDQNSVVRFILAVNRPKYGDSKPQADFIPVVAWRGTADFIGRNFRKGKQVYVSGRLQTTEWEKDGVKHYGFEIVARDVGFADSVSKQDRPVQHLVRQRMSHKVCRMYSQMMISTMPEDLMITLVVLVMTKNGRFK